MIVSVDVGHEADAMRNMLARRLQIFTGLLGIALTVISAQYLPERVATHFSFSGSPNAWSSNLVNTLFFSAMYLLMNALFLAIPWFVQKLPPSMINMPNRDYWLAPERHAQSVQKIGAYMAAFAVGVNLFMIAVESLTFAANRSMVPLSPVGIIAVGAAFFVFMILWIMQFIRAFRLPAH